MKIHQERLSRYITSRECKSTQDYLLDMYDKLSVETRLQIKEMLNKNKNDSTQSYNKRL